MKFVTLIKIALVYIFAVSFPLLAKYLFSSDLSLVILLKLVEKKLTSKTNNVEIDPRAIFNATD